MAISLLLGSFLLGCSPDGPAGLDSGVAAPAVDLGPVEWYHDYFTATFELCGEPDTFRPYSPMGVVEGDWPEMEYFVSDECYAALFADLHFNVDSVPTEYYEGDPELSASWRESRFWKAGNSLYALLSLPQGTLDQLDDLDGELDLFYVDDRVIDYWQALGAEVGEDRVRALVYNLVASSILRLDWVDSSDVDYNAAADRDTRVVEMTFEQVSTVDAMILLHEAAHLWWDVSHVACPEGHFDAGRKVCDETWFGPYGIGAATAHLQRQYYPWDEEPEASDYYYSMTGGHLRLIEDMIIEQCCAGDVDEGP